MEQKYKYLLKNTGILTISNFSSKILVFLLVPLYTGVLSTAEYGTFDLIMSTIQFLMPLLSINIYEAVMRFFMDKESDKMQVTSIGLKYVLIGSFLFALVIETNKLFNIWEELSNLSLVTILYFISYLTYQYMIQLAKGMEKVKDIAIASIVGTTTTVGLNVVLLLFVRAGLSGFFWAYIWGQLCPAIYLCIRIKLYKYILFKIDKTIEIKMIKYSVPLIMNTIGWWVNNVSDRYVVTFICGVAINGIYSVSYKIPSILNIIQQIFVQAWQISAIKEYEKKDSAMFYGNALDVLNFIMCLICMALVFLTRPMAKFLFSNDFFSAWEFVPFLLVSGVINSAAGILGPILSAEKNTKAMGQSALVGALSNVLLNIVLVYNIGAQGAAIATAISSYIIYIMRRKAVGSEIKDYNKTALYLSWVIIVVQSFVEIFTKWNIVQLLLISIVILFYRDVVNKLFNSIKNLI